MGKKDKDKHRKKHKHEGEGGPFAVPRPPPWPWPRPIPGARPAAPQGSGSTPGSATAGSAAPASAAAPVPGTVPGAEAHAADADAHAADAHAADEHAVDEHAVDEHAVDEHAVDEHAVDEHAMDDHDEAESGADSEGFEEAAAPISHVTGDPHTAHGAHTTHTANGAHATHGAHTIGSAGDEAPVSLGRADGDGETIDMADIADIAPVVPRDAGEGAAPTSLPPHVMEAGRPTVEELTQQIRDLESRLDRMLDERRAVSSAPPATRSSSLPLAAPRAPELDWNDAGTAPPATATGTGTGTPTPSAHELLSSEFYLRQWGKSGMRRRAEEVDEFGFDPAYEEKWRPFIDLLYRYYFRVDAQGVSQIPGEGRCIIVANHAGGPLPYDGLMLRAAVRREHESKRDLRWLAEDFVFYLPFVGAGLNRLGAVRACQENAERLLSRERLVAVFPEGAKGIGKLFGDRYRLQRFGRGGFIRLCLRTGTPIVPCAIVGAEEANPTVYRVESLAKLVGLPYLPVTPTFPALGPVGLLPAPTKWTLRFGAPIRFTTYGPEAADDDLLVSRLAEGVRGVIQDMLSRMLAKRKSIWLG